MSSTANATTLPLASLNKSANACPFPLSTVIVATDPTAASNTYEVAVAAGPKASLNVEPGANTRAASCEDTGTTTNINAMTSAINRSLRHILVFVINSGIRIPSS